MSDYIYHVTSLEHLYDNRFNINIFNSKDVATTRNRLIRIFNDNFKNSIVIIVIDKEKLASCYDIQLDCEIVSNVTSEYKKEHEKLKFTKNDYIIDILPFIRYVHITNNESELRDAITNILVENKIEYEVTKSYNMKIFHDDYSCNENKDTFYNICIKNANIQRIHNRS